MTSLYTEVPLGNMSRMIRILELSPLDTSTTNIVLHGRLVSVRLAHKPNYTALSYVWGPPEYTHSITLNGLHTLPITETLFAALKELASDRANAQGFSLWVDQICINQADDVEKAYQVKIMSDIFSQASLVVGWLGPADKNSDGAMDLLRYFSLDTSSPEKAKMGRDLCCRFDLNWTVDQESHTVSPLQEERNNAGLACVLLLHRQWFKRLWIVQELVLARKLELRCGSTSISGKEFFTALESSEWKARLRVGSFSKPLTERISSLWRLRSKSVLAGDWPPYHILAHDFQEWECGNDLDRLNALYGMGETQFYRLRAFERVSPDVYERAEKSFEEESYWFSPAYNISATNHYFNFASNFLKAKSASLSKALEILHYAGHGSFFASHLFQSSNSRPSCPSWVPDWRIRNRAKPLSFFNESTNSISNQKLKFRINDALKTLTIWAWSMDRISNVFQTIFSSTDSKIVQDIFSLSERYAGVKLEYFILAIAMEGRLGRSDHRKGMDKEELVKAFKVWKERQESFEHTGSNEFESMIRPQDTDTSVERFATMTLALCRNRSFFETESGRLGVGPAHVKEGDYISIIHGLRSPFVIRKHTSDWFDQAHILMGDCYVNGIMDETWHSRAGQEGGDTNLV